MAIIEGAKQGATVQDLARELTASIKVEFLDAGLVTVDRKLLDDALGQIEETWLNDYPQCTACTAEWNSGEVDHRPDCRYVRVADALWRALK